MLIPAMAFAWCVMSAEAETANAARPEAVTAPVPRSVAKKMDVAVAPVPAATNPGEERMPIRTAIPLPVIEFAKTLVNLPMGAEHVEAIDGQRYVFVLERHYHPPGFVGAPNGWHKGVTAYALKSSDSQAN